MFAHRSTLCDVPQAIEIDVGATIDRNERLPGDVVIGDIFLDCRNTESAGGLNNRAGVFKNVANGSAYLVGIDRDELVYMQLAKPKRLIADAPHRYAVSKNAYVIKNHRLARSN